jgi:hypothetical protein
MGNCRTTGFQVFGQGVVNSRLLMGTVTTNPNFLLTNTTVPGGAGQYDMFYPVMKYFGITGNVNGSVFQMGQFITGDTHPDPINEAEIDMAVSNGHTAGSASAAKLRFVLNGDIRLVCNVSGTGFALILHEALFNTIQGSFSALSGTGILMNTSFNYGNVFNNVDIENVATCLNISNANVTNNTFVGGQWNYQTVGITATLGASNLILNPNILPSTMSGASLNTFINTATGIIVKSNNGPVPATPSITGSPFTTSNTRGQTVQVFITGGTVSAISVDGTSTGLTAGGSFNNGATVILNPGSFITLTYSGSPSWSWRSFI